MKCEGRFEEILALESGDLDGVAESELRAHLSDCPVCAEDLTVIRNVGSHIAASLAHPELVTDITESVMARISMRRTSTVGRLVLGYAGLLAAACILVFVMCKANLLRSPSELPRAMTIAKYTPTGSNVTRLKDQPRPIYSRIADRRIVRPRHQRASQLAALQHRRPRFAGQVSARAQATAGMDLKIEIRVNASGTKVIASAGSIECFLRNRPRQPLTRQPPNSDIANIERPPLRTVAGVSRQALLLSQM